MFKFIKNIFFKFGGFLGWVYAIIPDSVKDKFPGVKKASFKTMIFSVLKIFAHWYFLIFLLAIIVTSRLFLALKNAGILDKFEEIVMNIVSSILYISEVCFPKILDLKDMMQCINGS